MGRTHDWKQLLDPTVTIGDLLSGRFPERPQDVVLAHDGLDFCLRGPTIEPGDYFLEGAGPLLDCPAVCLEVWLGGFPCWAPLTRTGARLLVEAVRPRLLARHAGVSHRS